MTEETKSAIVKSVDWTKLQSWKWFGSLLMEPKTDADGNTVMAMSLSKVQKAVSILMAVVLFGVMIGMWISKPEAVAETNTVTDPIPDSMLYTLWSLLGLSGVNGIASAIVKKD